MAQRPLLRENHVLRTEELSKTAPCRRLTHFSQTLPNSSKDMPPFNRSKIFTWSLKLSTLSFTFLWEAYFHKTKGRKHSTDHTMIYTQLITAGLTDSTPAFTELCNAHGNLKFLVLKFLVIFNSLLLAVLGQNHT
jgi:hypothetical protein